jgi:prophage DNA circulation protein
MIDIIGLYDSLLSASISGFPFEVLDTRQEFGRRIERFLFPGIDQPVFQDFGAQDNQISVTGMLIGDDYVQQAQNFRRVLQLPGPMTLVHPWLGNLQVILAGPSAVNIELSNTTLRVARFTVTLFLYQPPPVTLADTLSLIGTAVQSAVGDVQNWMAGVLAPLVLPLAAFAYAQGFVRSISAGFAGLVNSGASGAEIGPVASGAIAAMNAVPAVPGAAWASSLASAISAIPASIVAAAQPGVPSAVAPGGASVAASAASPADAVAMLLQAVSIATAHANDPAPGPALAACLQALIVAQAVQAAALINYQSVQQAQAQELVLMGALDAVIAAAASQAQSAPQLAAPVWDDLIGLKAALAADTNALIGRLPEVVSISTIRAHPAWLIAHYIAGDMPGAMAASYADLIARNQVVNPAMVPPGTLEVLQVA